MPGVAGLGSFDPKSVIAVAIPIVTAFKLQILYWTQKKKRAPEPLTDRS
jgi:hypothetical protein